MTYEQPKTVADALDDIKRARRFIILGAIVGLIAAALFLLFAIPCYKAEMTITPANPLSGIEAGMTAPNSFSSDQDPNTTRYLIQQQGAPNLADFTRFENMFSGASVAEELLKDEKITKGLLYDRPATMTINGDSWTPEKLSEYIKKRVRIEPVGATPLRRLTYFHPSPGFAVYFLNQIYHLTDGRIRGTVKEAATQRIGYMQSALDGAQNPDHRRAIAALLTEQERLLMLVSIDQPYAASIVEPAASSSKPQWPDKALALLSLIFVGALAGFILHGLQEQR